MQISDTAKIKAWDEYTITNEPVTSIELMERAAKACFEWLIQHNYKSMGYTLYALEFRKCSQQIGEWITGR